jgi:hypothetical protein
VELKKPWPKVHFRKCKAFKVMGRLKEVKNTVEIGLMYDPNNNEYNLLLKMSGSYVESYADVIAIPRRLQS